MREWVGFVWLVIRSSSRLL